MSEPLHLMPVETWDEIKKVLHSDFPRCLSGYTFLDNMEGIMKLNLDYGVKVYCPYGNLINGIVALNVKNSFYEVIIQCPNNDTTELEEALKTTKVIDWARKLEVPFAPKNVRDCMERIINERNYTLQYIDITDTFILKRNAMPFDIRLAPELSFKLLTLHYKDTVNNAWPHKYPGSDWYFELLIKANLGYGLFKGDELISWVFIKEMGALGHLYTLEEHRRKGYGELVLKLISNVLLNEGKYVVAFCVKGNENACKLYKKLNFENVQVVYWCNFIGN
ncbi:uncharacterized protein LOC116771817 [Danaus plexippus]|uniref:uncharacterized protein LOC116771817 n=1 Tax=Danaus plexippus TaxID=13037 RepID=UPI002AB015D3|nr:uncharacterized protein LOC116771817 [Danaus plexippus]